MVRVEVIVETIKTDILVLGSGAAGLYFALKASRFAEVLVVTKRACAESNTYYAQGGIASVTLKEDSFERHVADTLETGQGLCKREAVEILVREGPDRIRDLVELGVRFSKNENDDSLSLTREGGHSAPRIVHYRDVIGRELETTLLAAVRGNARIATREEVLAIDLIADPVHGIAGCYALDGSSREMVAILARHTVLATGGAGKIYLYTSNPDVATGDGIAMAYRAGAAIANLEFVQFHPTCLYHPEAKSFLISETLRGEGAILRNLKGENFMKRYDPRGELAPRDVVARAIDSEMKKSGDKYVLLDITHRSSDWLRKRFPNVYENCLSFGIDIAKQPMPVVPAAHYMCGGVLVDMDGRTDLEGLTAIGEVSCSGVHGANRLDSNSLLEALVLGARSAARLERELHGLKRKAGPALVFPEIRDPKVLETVILDHDWDLSRRVMWDYVGIVRSEKRLSLARDRIAQILETVERIFAEYGISDDIVELRNIALVSSLVVESAIMRKESRGLHYVIDYPAMDPAWEKDTIVKKRLE
ncbi:MAG: L-aspartate oxidase [Candidatus Krumholzibacteria bacterium]|nr:L-aspartate oxidase [Candidatus Krumholzibacteria bacterium]